MDRIETQLASDAASLLRLAWWLSGSQSEAERLLAVTVARVRRRGRLATSPRLDLQLQRAMVHEFISWRRVFTSLPSRHGMARLHPRQWSVLVLADGVGLGEADIAVVMGCPISIVEVTAQRARGRLRRAVGGRVHPESDALPRAPLPPFPLEPGPASNLASAVVTNTRHRRVMVPIVAGACGLGVVVAIAVAARQDASDLAPVATGPTLGVAHTDPAVAARAALVLSRFQAAFDAAAPPRLLVLGPMWEQVGVKDPEAGARLMRGKLRDDMPPIDDRAAVGTVRYADNSESMTPVLGLHETFADLAKETTPCPKCPPVVGVEGRLTSMSIKTPTGKALAPAQEYRFKQATVRIRRLAIPKSSLVMLSPVPGGEGYVPVDSVVIVPTGLPLGGPVSSLTVRFTPTPTQPECGQSYRAMAVESQDAVAVLVVPDSRSVAPKVPTSCPSPGVARTLSVDLTAQLGRRVVLDGSSGHAVPVSLARASVNPLPAPTAG